MNIPACIRGAADWVRNFSASDVPQVAATVAIPMHDQDRDREPE